MATSILRKSSGSNMWRKEGRIVIPKRGMVFYAPLWHPQLSGSPFNAWDVTNNTVYSCTATGAIWIPQGRTFDGVDDNIVVPDAASLRNIANLTICVWLTWHSEGEANGRVLDKVQLQIYTLPDRTFIAFRGFDGGTNASTKSAALTADTWTFMVFQLSSATKKWTIRKNNADSTNVLTTGVGNMKDDTANLYIGDRAGSDRALDGKIGDYMIFNRLLSSNECDHLYLATKWRYQ